MMNNDRASKNNGKAIHYITNQQDRLDRICVKFYGKTCGVVEAILGINPNLADYGSYFPAGVAIELPPLETLTLLPQDKPRKVIHLWD
jgi:phage tail protein X